MYSLELTCLEKDLDLLTAELWEAGTIGIREVQQGDGYTLLIAAFAEQPSSDFEVRFLQYTPQWRKEEDIDWVEHTQRSWPGRPVGQIMYLCPPWAIANAPPDRLRIVHTPGMACGTGEHPCTQLALEALERTVQPGWSVADIGSGSGILTSAALLLGAGWGLAADNDESAMAFAQEDFHRNQVAPLLVTGSADALADELFDLTIANISGTVLLSIMDDLLRVTKPRGLLILTGFTEAESVRFQDIFPVSKISSRDGWACLEIFKRDNLGNDAP
jgi:ribosomal protein L11 methyltransferase